MLTLLMLACKGSGSGLDTEDPAFADADADGWSIADGDCNDGLPEVHPEAPETCNYLDDNCDGTTDEGTENLWFLDADGDGYGDEASAASTCTQPTNYISTGGDCDDANHAIFPGAEELCDGADGDCDGEADDGATKDWYTDADGDGYGEGDPVAACLAPEGSADNNFDCDDARADVNPAASDGCDTTDNDCDGDIDEDPDLTWYRDGDSDGVGAAADSVTSCETPTGYVGPEAGFDCDDTEPAVGAGEPEVCDGLDNDCDGTADNDASDALTFWTDADGDGWGLLASVVEACTQPSGTSTLYGDCDDADPAANPGEVEVCGGADEDCDGTTDEGSAADAPTIYRDRDGDGAGDPAAAATSCTVPSGFSASGDDCDDGDATALPGGSEVCDGADNDCDGSTDGSDASDASTWYADGDGDGYGDSATIQLACEKPSSYVADSTDCDDGRKAVNPGALESCDSRDNDCDGSTDESDAIDAEDWYADLDGDGYGDAASTTTACDQPSGSTDNADDCDDSDADTNPGADELCGGGDEDCDGSVDEADAIDGDTWYRDADGDTYGDPARTKARCTQPSGYVADATDCDDGAKAVSPAGTELCDAVDNDCDGSTDEDSATDADTWYKDADSDGYGDPASTTTACEAPSGYLADATDCDDSDSSVHPTAAETCGGGDEDCDGTTDENSAADTTTWYSDADGDGYGDPSTPTVSCSAPSGAVTDSSDCDDSDATISPAGTEVCDGSEDEDCDGLVDEPGSSGETTWYYDADGDGYGRSTTTQSRCTAPSSFVSNTTDCDDTDSSISPAGTEVCGGTDEDCDGLEDDDDSSVTGTSTWYVDSDGDGYGDSSTSTAACVAPSGYDNDAKDCDDADSAVSPAVASETCGDGVDNDCDGAAVGCTLASAAMDEDDAALMITGVTEVGSIGYFGEEVVFADLDGDLLEDVVSTAYVNGGYYRGKLYVFDSSTGHTGSVLATEADTVITHEAAYQYLGHHMDTGDWYGDGSADLMVAAYTGANASSYQGTVYVLDGPLSDGAITKAGFSVYGATAYDYLGSGFAAAGDIDGDADEDLAVGAYAADGTYTDQGAVYIVEGPRTGNNSVSSVTTAKISGASAYEYLGAEVANVGDTDGDGLMDLLIGAPRQDGGATDGGAAYLVLGPAATTGTAGAVSSVVLRCSGSSCYFGEVKAAGGDIDGDGYSDVAVGAPRYSSGTKYGFTGIWYGPLTTSGNITTAAWSATGTSSSSDLGSRVALGDMDGDGTLDLAATDPYLSNGSVSYTGGSYIFVGITTGTTTTASASGKVLGNTSGTAYGTALDLGDADGDGKADLLMGAYGYSGGDGLTTLWLAENL